LFADFLTFPEFASKYARNVEIFRDEKDVAEIPPITKYKPVGHCQAWTLSAVHLPTTA
jgi:hypothetical protein